jgi:hypothetical protein
MTVYVAPDLLRQIGARTREALQEALEEALTTVSASDTAGWFAHCGYSLLLLSFNRSIFCEPL